MSSLNSTSNSSFKIVSIFPQYQVFFHKGASVYPHNTLLLTDRHDTSATSKWVHMVMDPDNIIHFKSLSCGPENQVFTTALYAWYVIFTWFNKKKTLIFNQYLQL